LIAGANVMSEATSTSFGIPGVVPDPTTAPAAPNIPLLTQLKRGVFGSFFIAQKDKVGEIFMCIRGSSRKNTTKYDL
jgi:hypothetical protein